MNDVIVESGMNFITENSFYIEKSSTYSRIKGEVRSVEFIRSKGNSLIFIEAKSSFPNPNNPAIDQDKGKTRQELFKEEVADICDKFTHSLNLYSAVAVGVIKDGFPTDYKPTDKADLTFVLIINGFKKSWCPDIEKALNEKLSESVCITKIWKPKVMVMNNETAAKYQLITT